MRFFPIAFSAAADVPAAPAALSWQRRQAGAGYPDYAFEELADGDEASRELGFLVRCVQAARDSGA